METTEQDWLDALNGPITVLLNVLIIAGAIGIILGLYLLVRSTPNAHQRNHSRSPYGARKAHR